MIVDRPSAKRHVSRLAAIALAAACMAFPQTQALALSELQRDEAPAPETVQDDAISPRQPLPPATGLPVPLPDPVTNPKTPAEAEEPEIAPGDGIDDSEDATDETPPGDASQEPLPEVVYDLDRLPEPVRRMHRLIVEACKAGDIEALRPLVGAGDSMTQLSLGGIEGDAIDFLKELSGDGEGHEILAILLEVLDAGYVHVDIGKPEELYVWPYFFAVPLDRLEARQRVELFKIVTAGDYEDMKSYGAYIFYRVGITPEGRWAFFVAGD